MINNWTLLKKELSYYGILLINNKQCQLSIKNKIITQGIIKTIRQINISIKKQKKQLMSLWKEIIDVLQDQNISNDIIDHRMIDLFIFSLKDLSKFLLCFEDTDNSPFQDIIDYSLCKDIKMFNKEQIYSLPDYKISIDWINRLICRLKYVVRLLSFAVMGEKKIGKFEVKMAQGVSGPWSRLDIPLKERVFEFGNDLETRTRAKQKQKRYRKGFDNYNAGEGVSEGYYWREPRNEPYSWCDRKWDSPYPRSTMPN